MGPHLTKCLFLAVVMGVAVVGPFAEGLSGLSERLTSEEVMRQTPHFEIPAFVSNEPVNFRLTEGDCYLTLDEEEQGDSWACNPSPFENTPPVPVILITQTKNPFQAKIKYYYWASPPYHKGEGKVRIYPGEGVKATRRRMEGGVQFTYRKNGRRSTLLIKLPLSGKFRGLVNPPHPPTKDFAVRNASGKEKTLRFQYCPLYPIPYYVVTERDEYFEVRQKHDLMTDDNDVSVMAGPPCSRQEIYVEEMGPPKKNTIAYMRLISDNLPLYGRITSRCKACVAKRKNGSRNRRRDSSLSQIVLLDEC